MPKREKLTGRKVAGLTLEGITILDAVHCECDKPGHKHDGPCTATAVYQIGGLDDESDLPLYVCRPCAESLLAQEAGGHA
jgi:hypothetical protein